MLYNKIRSVRFAKGQTPWNKGIKTGVGGPAKGTVFTVEHREKLRISKLKKPTRYWLGKRNPISEETRKKLSIANSGKRTGKESWNWKGGVSRDKHNGDSRYVRWRIAVFKRDDFVCQACGIIGGMLNAHHIKGWADYPELRYDVDNGRTLCVPCHKLTDNYGNNRIKRIIKLGI